ncbi:MAG: BON domain-containing protein [Gammaproteobacteria bacterium]|nr:BON domain-containing protein [Gammaproteobacteria bacterium]NNJ71623.1 BON domain-containing protein [Enterobacterales bacterium]
MRKIIALNLILISLLMLPGCAALVATTAIVGTDMATDRRTSGIYIEDQRIEISAKSDISESTALDDNTDLAVTSFNRIVLITGQAPTPELKQLATSIVRKVDNVRKVHNEVRIRAPESMLSGTNDAWLTTKTKSMLFAEDDLNSQHIKVLTENGEVFLMGMVTRNEAEKAINVVREIDGVERVVEVFEYID